ncbi:DUF397 domain-containing protein [Streptomyces sp. NPDC019443]|uniref:DUF397 domain-containing protein n=1 Tax=Streptomyces sp. NPDC019443 TaxID=3365061 RepID=UPI00379449CE
MTITPFTGDQGCGLEWLKSTYSADDGPSCVEVANTPGTVHVRDSKNTQGPQLAFGPATWADFVGFASGD